MSNYLLITLFLLTKILLSNSSSCSWSDSGHTLDLSSISGTTVTASSGQFSYEYSVCSNSESCNGQSAMIIQTNEQGMCIASLATYSSSDSASYSSSDGGTWSFEYDGAGSNNCDSRSLTLYIVCDSSSVGDASCSETKECNYEFTFYSSYACSSSSGSSSSSSMSGGSVFLLIFFLFLSLYCIGGYAWNVYKRPESAGWKDYKNNVPNLEFWMMVPQWTKSGCIVTKEFVTQKYYAYRGQAVPVASNDAEKTDDVM